MTDKKSPWISRIVEHKNADPNELAYNEKNWREHPAFQRKHLRNILDEVGFVQSVIFNTRTNRLVDGHLRVEEARKAGVTSIPVAYVDISEKEEKLVLAALDPIAGLAVADDKILSDILNEVRADYGDILGGLHTPEVDFPGDTDSDSNDSLSGSDNKEICSACGQPIN